MRHIGLKLRMLVTGTILFGLYALAGVILYSLFGSGVVPLLLIGSVGLIGLQYVMGVKGALMSVGAEDLPRDRYPKIHSSVERICDDVEMEKPRLMIADMGVPNAFAVGRRGNGTVVISRELIQTLEFEELEGVIAHELSHIDNRDVVMMVVGQGIASILGIVAQWAIILGDEDLGGFFAGIIAGIVAQTLVMIVVLAISRTREYVADSDAARHIGSGEPLARALEKIDSQGRSKEVPEDVNALCIFGGTGRLLATHPPMEKRIERLRSSQP
ncbi:MAG: M48 family metallopeptidase [Halobacteria archaeon]